MAQVLHCSRLCSVLHQVMTRQFACSAIARAACMDAGEAYQEQFGDGTEWARRPISRLIMQAAFAGVAPLFSMHGHLRMQLGVQGMDIAREHSQERSLQGIPDEHKHIFA